MVYRRAGLDRIAALNWGERLGWKPPSVSAVGLASVVRPAALGELALGEANRAKPPLASFEGLRSLTLRPFFVAAFFCVAILLFFSSVGCLCGVSDTEQQLMAAFDVPFRD